MKPINFKHSNITLQPSGKTYSDNVTKVTELPIWTDGEQCLSCWKMSWRERFSSLIFGRVWISALTGSTQPPIFAMVEKEYLKEVAK